MASLVCQVCDRECDPDVSFAASEELDQWITHYVDLVSSQVRIITCPTCGVMPSPDILDLYKKRIREGRDFRYH